MTSGGRRVRSGPAPDPNSRTSERRGYTLKNLPNTPYSGRAPNFPLPPYVVRHYDQETQEWNVDHEASDVWNDREATLWKMLWKLPQARAWRQPQLRYLTYAIGLYVRECVVCEQTGAKAADIAARLRMEDRIGLSEAGMQVLGWRIAEENVDMAATEVPATDVEAAETGNETKIVHFPRRMRA